jgi:hypothetical protein
MRSNRAGKLKAITGSFSAWAMRVAIRQRSISCSAEEGGRGLGARSDNRARHLLIISSEALKRARHGEIDLAHSRSGMQSSSSHAHITLPNRRRASWHRARHVPSNKGGSSFICHPSAATLYLWSSQIVRRTPQCKTSSRRRRDCRSHG